MSIDFYKALEDRYRGSRDSIRSRLQTYLPFVKAINNIYPRAKATDLGCGRGEWLEILADYQYSAKGVDLDDSMLSACRELGLDVQTSDALAYLHELKDESQAIITAFHLIEHLAFDDLRELVAESMRALKPAGLLILETPNPENIVVGTCNFYLDPTHRHPIPPKLLAFTAEYYGFNNVKIIRLNEPRNLISRDNVSLFAVLHNVSPDYAVIAQKPASQDLIHTTREAFDVDYGITLEQLAQNYDLKFEHITNEARRAKKEAEDLAAQLENVHSSRSWRFTRPVRWLAHQTRLVRQRGLLDRLNALVTKLTNTLIHKGVTFLKSHPKLRTRLVSVIKALGLSRPAKTLYHKIGAPSHSTLRAVAPHDLSARARCIYQDLVTAIAATKGNR